MKKLLQLFILAAASFICAEEPLLRVGVITDTHIGETAESCSHVRKAFQLFRTLQADLIVNCGDIADKHYPSGYRHYRQIFNEIFPDRKPKELFVYAGHDAIGIKDKDHAYAIVRKELGATNDLYDRIVLKGYPFLVFMQSFDTARYEADIVRAEREFPGKPVFVFNHEPPLNTTYHSQVWGSAKVRQVLEKHPRVIQFSGHAHSSIRDERNIWQGKFTSISAGCLQRWAGVLTGSPTFGKRYSDGVLFMEIFPEKLVIRRYEYTTGKEYGADKRWIIPLPFDEKTAPFTPERRYADVPAPAFPAGAELRHNINTPGVNLKFPEAADGVAEYRIDVLQKADDGTWQETARCDRYSGFYLHTPPEEQQITLDRGYFEPGQSYRVRVTPMSFWKKGGKPLETTFTMPPYKPQIIFQSLAPMKEMAFQNARTGEAVKAENGFYRLKYAANLQIPEKVWEGPAQKSRFRLTVDFQMEQTRDRPWIIMVLDPRNNACVSTRIGTVPGNSGMMRYSLEFPKHSADARYVIQFRNGAPGKVKFGKLRIEKTR